MTTIERKQFGNHVWISVITIIVSVFSTYFISQAQQDSAIAKNTTEIRLTAQAAQANTERIMAILKTYEVNAPSLLNNKIENLTKEVNEMKASIIKMQDQQQEFYVKMAAKFGIVMKP